MGGGYFPGTIPQTLGALSVLLASVNVAGGFVITKRMLDMFKRTFFFSFFGLILNLKQILSQDRLIRPSIPGYTAFPLWSLLADSWRLRVLAWLVSCKPDT